jgi:phosphoadenosine phosphosulfate reductase
MLVENRIIDGKIVEYDKVQVAIQRLQSFEPSDGYWLAFSGGKDSCVIKELANMAGVKYEAHYSLTTVDPPELVRFINVEHPGVIVDRPKKTMWQLIVDNGPPTRINRFCCKYLKESSGIGRVTVTGVRWAESNSRRKDRHLVDIGEKEITFNEDNSESRRVVESCYRTAKTLVNPIVDWSDDDVWNYIHKTGLRYCSLYDEGWSRLGCIGCPMNTRGAEQFKRWPTYKTAYIHAFDRFIARRKSRGNDKNLKWKTGQECFEWWISDNKNNDETMDGQMELTELQEKTKTEKLIDEVIDHIMEV